jgi:hypothetical protein
MNRYVHHQLRAVVSILAAGAVAATVADVVRGFSPPSTGGPRFVAILFALLLVSTLLKATRIKGFSDVRHFEAAVPSTTPTWSCPPTASCATSRSAGSSSCCT